MELKIEKQSRGVRIICGDEAKERRILLNSMIKISESFGFNEIIIPSIEPSSIYMDKAGKEILNQMYTFNDKAGRELCLRPEGTATIQLIADKYYKTQKDVKLWYFEKCYRYERPQKGRYREFFQFGVEVINPSSPSIEDELIEMAKQMVMLRCVENEIIISSGVKRGLAYYVDGGFEISVYKLGAQKQVCGGGQYKQGSGFAIGFDRLMLC